MSLSTRKKMKGSFPLLSTNIPHFTVENLGKDGDKKLRGWGMVSPAGDLLCPRRQSRQSAAGGGSRAFNNALSRLPRTPCFFYGGATKGRGYIHPVRAKDRIPLLTPPAAAPCWLNRLMLLQERSRLVFRSRVAGRWTSRLRGWCLGQGSGCSTPRLLVCSGPSAR